MYYKLGLKHYYYYFRVCSNKYYCLLKKKNKNLKLSSILHHTLDDPINYSHQYKKLIGK